VGIDVPKIPREKRKLKLKRCLYPECQNLFQGKGFSKYCSEHRQRQYRKVIDKLNKKVIITENPNQTYRHENTSITTVTFVCILCGKKFDIVVYPNIYIYPKYCEDHRNLYKRTLWLKSNSIYVPEIKQEEIIDETQIGELPPEMPILTNISAEEELFSDYDEDIEMV
jgi:hypothetical protein